MDRKTYLFGMCVWAMMMGVILIVFGPSASALAPPPLLFYCAGGAAITIGVLGVIDLMRT